MRISKESLFSDLNNLKIYSVVKKKYDDKFGFTEQEVFELFQRAAIQKNLDEIKKWFNGYTIGNSVIYNPWSIINCLSEEGILKSYWVNTSGNALIREKIIEASPIVKEKIRRLISGKAIKELLDEHIVFSDLKQNTSALWSLLVMCGYLKIIESVEQGRHYLSTLKIPNYEILEYYRSEIELWLSGEGGVTWYYAFLEDLRLARIEAVEEKLQTLIEGVLSYHDTHKNAPEMFFHGLTLGLTAGLSDFYEIQSNREAGLGRFDLAFCPKNKKVGPGILMEFKAPNTSQLTSTQTLACHAKAALSQIEQRDYAAIMRSREIERIVKIGIAFYGKEIKVVSNKEKMS